MSSRKRTSVPLTEKKKYAQMILKGASRSTISDLYRKKYNSELSERTFRQWKKDSKSILEAKSNHEFIKERKKSSSMQKFEEKIKSEYVKRKIKLKKTGLTAFVRQIHTEFFGDDEEISNLKLSSRFIARIIRDCGRKTSKRTDRAFLVLSTRTSSTRKLMNWRSMMSRRACWRRKKKSLSSTF
jgi:hypothetical protein